MEKKQFKIKGKKDLFFKRDGDSFTVFDPVFLEYYGVDIVGAEILYCLSKNFTLNQIAACLVEEYDIDTELCKASIIDFLNNVPIKDLIYPNLILTDIYLELEPFAKV
ncbi:Uncharacterised protein [Enterococcus casseliflavus]|uniref:PqqD family peptide maturation chaperone WgkC n=1 Tax=Enterococcus TaxID=1350 RepID=UPI000E013A7C|nr:PqqD family protein [Enterococcus casseliflavus]GEB28237.1 hypothetical protein ECA02_13320 [Enterococcus casseliflavus]STP36774.1 Uncharacterised protein [Enterococcus casseliflavus]